MTFFEILAILIFIPAFIFVIYIIKRDKQLDINKNK